MRDDDLRRRGREVVEDLLEQLLRDRADIGRGLSRMRILIAEDRA